MRLLATALFIIQMLFIPGPQTVYVPDLAELDELGIPVDYYDQGCAIPIGMSVEYWLTELAWHRPLELHVWDCSDTASYTEWVLENCGYDTAVVLTQLEDEGHVFVIVDIDGVRHEYEATTRDWVAQVYWPRFTIWDIYEIYEWAERPEWFAAEWAWWQR